MLLFRELEKLVKSLETDFYKFYVENNKAAGTRLRKGMMGIKNLAQNIREEVQERKMGDK